MGSPTTRIIAVGGGKGGVGKSVVTSNLAVALARLGTKVVVVDVDLGGSNLHSMFGIRNPDKTIEHFLEGHCSSLDEVAIDSGVDGLKLLCGMPQVLGQTDSKKGQHGTLVQGLGQIEADCLLIDIGAGSHLSMVDFFNAADIRLVVLTPEVTSVQNAYGFTKIATYRRFQKALKGYPVSGDLKELLGDQAFQIASRMGKVETFFDLIQSEMPELVEILRLLLTELNISLVGNMLLRPEDRDVIFAVQRMINKFLGLNATVAACLRQNSHVRESVNSGQPLMLGRRADPDTAEFTRLARSLLDIDLEAIHQLRAQLAGKLNTAEQALSLGLDDIEFVDDEIDAATFREKVEEHFGAPASEKVDEGAGRDEGINETQPSGNLEVSDADGTPETKIFLKKLNTVMRSSERLEETRHVQLRVDGNWLLGSLEGINTAGACISGIRIYEPPTSMLVAMRIVSSGNAGAQPDFSARLSSHDNQTGRVVIQFGASESMDEILQAVRDRCHT